MASSVRSPSAAARTALWISLTVSAAVPRRDRSAAWSDALFAETSLTFTGTRYAVGDHDETIAGGERGRLLDRLCAGSAPEAMGLGNPQGLHLATAAKDHRRDVAAVGHVQLGARGFPARDNGRHLRAWARHLAERLVHHNERFADVATAAAAGSEGAECDGAACRRPGRASQSVGQGDPDPIGVLDHVEPVPRDLVARQHVPGNFPTRDPSRCGAGAGFAGSRQPPTAACGAAPGQTHPCSGLRG